MYGGGGDGFALGLVGWVSGFGRGFRWVLIGSMTVVAGVAEVAIVTFVLAGVHSA